MLRIVTTFLEHLSYFVNRRFSPYRFFVYFAAGIMLAHLLLELVVTRSFTEATAPYQFFEGLFLIIVTSPLIYLFSIRPLQRRISDIEKAEQKIANLNRIYRTLSACNEALVHAKTEQDLFERLCRAATKQGGYRLAWVGIKIDDEVKTIKPVAYGGYEKGYLDTISITWADTERGHGPTGTAARTGEVSVNNDTRTNPKMSPWREEALKRGYLSTIGLPLFFEGKPIGVFTMYAEEVGAFTDTEIRLLKELTGDLSFGISTLRTKKKLKETEKDFELLMEQSPLSIQVLSHDGKTMAINHAFEQLWGITMADLKDYNIFKDQQLVQLGIMHFIEEAAHGEQAFIPAVEYIAKKTLGKGNRKWVQANVYPVKDSDGNIRQVVLIHEDITKTKEAEREIARANIYNRSLIEASLDPLVTISAEGKITDVNKSTEQVTGKNRTELIGTDFSDYFTEPEKARAVYQKVFIEGKVVNYPLAIRHVDGHITEVLYNATVYHNNEGDIIGIFAAARDITEQKKSEERFRNTLDTMLEGCMIIDTKWTYLYVNEVAAAHGHNVRENLIGRTMFEVYPGVERSSIFAHYRECMEKRINQHFEESYTFPDGTTEWYEFSVHPLPDGIFVLSIDISERRNAEEKIKRDRAESEALLFNLGEGVVAVNLTGNVVVINRAAEKILQWSSDELIGKRFVDMIPAINKENITIPPEERSIMISIRTRSVSSNTFFFIAKDGSKVPVAVTATPVITEGKLIGGVVVFRDITRENELEKTRGDLLSLASHQLRTPLSGTKWLIETLQKGIQGPLTKGQKEYLDEIYKINERMTSLVYDMLNVLRMESTTSAPETERISSRQVVQKAVMLLTSAAESKCISLTVDMPDDHTIDTDKNFLQDILEVFISNAITYSPENSTVVISTKQEGDGMIFSVKDFGIGVPKNEQASLFERFYRASNAKTYNTRGTGLGLYIAATLAQKIGATLFFESEAGKGSTFSVRVPFAQK